MPVVCYFQPIGEGAIIINRQNSRLAANGQMFAVMKAHQGGKICKVTENDDFSTAASVKNGVLTITLINADYDQERNFNFPLKTKGEVLNANLYSSEDVLPYSYFNESPLKVTNEKKSIQTTLPPHSVAIIQMKLNKMR